MDLRVIQKRCKIPILSFSVKSIFNPPIVDIQTASGMLDVESVVINGEKSAKVSVISDTRVLAEIPSGTTEILRLEVFSYNSRAHSEYAIDNSFGVRPSTLSGIDKVVQKVIKVLLTTPGSDIFNQDLGAGIGTIISRNFADHGEASAEVLTSIQLAEVSIRESEDRSDMPSALKLGSINILEIVPIEKVGVSISLEITNRDGDTGRASVTI